MIRVLKPGLLTAVQDAGRHGYQRFGVSVGGAADPFALRVANALVGNNAKAAGLEMALAGPRLQFDGDTLVAWCGADFEATLDDQPLPRNRPVRVPAGGCLDFAAAKQGTMAWLAVGGGITVPEVMGSRSTDLIARIGGVEGRRLVAGDVLPVGVASAWTEAMLESLGPSAKNVAWSLPPERLGLPDEPGLLRVVRGPEWDWFAADAWEKFLRETYRVTRDSNRMGLRLAGPALALSARREMISAAVHHGVVQIPPSGQPILLGADRQTIGGYPRLGVVATVDWTRLAQFRPGDDIRFREVTIAQAHGLLLKRERDFALATGNLARRVGSP
jgi:antagonist of KipI